MTSCSFYQFCKNHGENGRPWYWQMSMKTSSNNDENGRTMMMLLALLYPGRSLSIECPTPAQSTCPCQWPQLVGSIVRRKLYRKHKRKNVVNTVVRHRDYNEIAPKCYEFNNSPWKSFFVIAQYHGVGSEIVEQCIWWWLEWPLMVSYGVCATQLW